MRHRHGIAYCIHCTTIPAVKYGCCAECLANIRAAITAEDVARAAAQRDPKAILCKACDDSACTLSDGLCPVCRRRIAA